MTVLTSYLVTGASRGLGLEFVKQVLEGSLESVVVAAARDPANAVGLTQLSTKFPERLHVIQLDCDDDDSMKAAVANAEELLPEGLDYLIANAGVGGGWFRARQETRDNIIKVLNTNCISIFTLIQLCLPLLQKGKKKTVVAISSQAGSCANWAHSADSKPLASHLLAYRLSKAALNMGVLAFAADLAGEGITVVALHPGWVSTDMGNAATQILGVAPPLDPPTSVGAMLKTISALSPDKSGAFLDWEGHPVAY